MLVRAAAVGVSLVAIGLGLPSSLGATTAYRGGGTPHPPPPDVDCSDFSAQAEAQEWLLPGDPHQLDNNGDGIACEGLPPGGGGPGGGGSGGGRKADVFRTPNHAAYCRMLFRRNAWNGFLCLTPNDGFWVKMTRVLGPGRVRVTEGYSPTFEDYRNSRARILGFGRTWFSSDAEIVVCNSQRTGLTCRHWQGRGWWLGRFHGYDVF
jgi:hypothetical protein